jgi:hypothetical protein
VVIHLFLHSTVGADGLHDLKHICFSFREKPVTMMVRMTLSTRRRLLLSLVAILGRQTAEAYFYVSYETPHAYTIGDWCVLQQKRCDVGSRAPHKNTRFLLFRIPLVANKLTSASALSSVGYNKFPLCNAPGVAADTDRSWWNQGLDALHGEDLVDVNATFPLMVGADVFCTTLCELDDAQRFQPAIRQEFHYNWFLGGLPVALRTEDEYVCVCL